MGIGPEHAAKRTPDEVTGPRRDKCIDPQLLRQLERATPGDSNVFAAIFLNESNPSDTRQFETRVNDLIRSLLEVEGNHSCQFNVQVQEFLSSFTITAPASLVSKLLRSPEIASAMPEYTSDDLIILPRVGSKPPN
jgi:hypothetical protein